MTQPRRHLPDETVVVDRRTAMGFFFLRPDETIDHIFRYEVGKAADRYDQHIHAATATSNGVQFVATDKTGERSGFMRDAMSGVARARNDAIGREGIFWGAGSFDETVTLQRETMEKRLLDVWLRPVKAGLVERVENWSGFQILPQHWGETVEIDAPDRFYGRYSPDTVEFTPQPPPGYDEMDLEELKDHFTELIREAEEEIHEQHPDRNYRGADAVRSDDYYDRPEQQAPRTGLVDRYEAQDQQLRQKVESDHRTFLEDYETMRQRWVQGKSATFPAGTVQLKKLAPVDCQPPDPDRPGRIGCG